MVISVSIRNYEIGINPINHVDRVVDFAQKSVSRSGQTSQNPDDQKHADHDPLKWKDASFF